MVIFDMFAQFFRRLFETINFAPKIIRFCSRVSQKLSLNLLDQGT